VRSAFVLNDCGAEFIHVKAQRETDIPAFVLKNISDFSLQQSWPLTDQRLERVEARENFDAQVAQITSPRQFTFSH
jgi:hypothetical protein